MSSPTAPPDDERQEELATIASIFPDEFAIFAPSSAVISLPVSPLEPLAVSFPSEPRALLRHLPPLLLKFVLPELYPAEAPPHIELSTTPPWLPQDTRDALKTECLKLWEDYGRGQVMFAIIDHAQQCAERGFGFNGELMLEDSMRDELLAFDLETRKSVFNQGTYNCGICLEPKKGAICHAIRSCGHIFCRPCLVNYFTSLITDGEVGSVRCSDGLFNPYPRETRTLTSCNSGVR